MITLILRQKWSIVTPLVHMMINTGLLISLWVVYENIKQALNELTN